MIETDATPARPAGPAASGSREAPLPLDNETLAERLDEIAALLEAQHANEYRVRAYRNAANIVRRQRRPVHEQLDRHGLEALTRISGIGDSLANTIEHLVHTDHVALLDRLRGQSRCTDAFTSVPGLGPELAHRIHEELGIESLAELEVAAHDGRLEGVPGMGPGRVQAVRDSLAGRYRRSRETAARRRHPRAAEHEPPVSELLEVDAKYRREAHAKRLPLVAPRRFNPTGAAWLPILHTERGGRHYTALFSNTARAHELGTTDDWVVIYRDDAHEDGGDGQWTVVTARFGPLAGQRIVRGRETECEDHHRRVAEHFGR